MMKKFLILFLFVFGFTFGQQKVSVDLSNPNATLYTHIYFLQPDNYNEAKAATTIHGIPREEAIDKVIKLKKIFDGTGMRLDFSKIPTDPDYIDSISKSQNGLERQPHKYIPFQNRMPDVYLEKINGKWYYSKQTVEKIDELYGETFAWEFSWLQSKFPKLQHKKFLGTEIWKLVGLLILLGISALLYYILKPIVFFILKKIQRIILHEVNVNSYDLLNKLARPIVFILLIRFIKKVLPSLQLVKFNSSLFIGFSIAETIFWIFSFLTIITLLFLLYQNHIKKTPTKLDEQLAPILKKIFNVVIILIGFLHILTLFGVDPTTVLAGASIGGIAIAFAAQDSVKNLIGTVVIFLDKPFHIGDWVEIGGVVGTVENVGLRSTRVRAADTSIFQIPNSKVTEAEVNNKGLRIYRRYKTELGIRYDTPPELIQAFVTGVRELVIAHPETLSESYNVEFTGFGDSSLLIMINLYFKELDWGIEQSSKHRLHMAIVKLAAALGVQFAFPSSTVMIEQFPEKKDISMKYDTDSAHIASKVEEILENFKRDDVQKDPNSANMSN
jgi:MscS family membrane protein